MNFFKITLMLLSVLFTIAMAEKTEKGLFFNQSIGVSYNPLGLLLDSKLFYRFPLINKSGLLWESTGIETGIQNEWTPADNNLSARVTVEPIAVCDIVFKAGFYGMYNNLGYGCFRLALPDDAYGPNAQKKIGPTNAFGYWLSVTPTLKAKLGRFIILNSLAINRVAIDGNGYFLEVRSYLPHRTRDNDIINDTYLMVECTKWLITGTTYRYVYVTGTSARSQRLSAIAIFKPQGKFLSGSFAAINAGAYLDDPLFTRTMYVGGIFGKEFRLGQSLKEKEGKK
jgi:hypothetical protein